MALQLLLYILSIFNLFLPAKSRQGEKKPSPKLPARHPSATLPTLF